ncbi:hypothetical protein LUZ60_006487 [Juncus effusus]|nr:hypothetical protein LUZ60_006487 [Juncus effusus]
MATISLPCPKCAVLPLRILKAGSSLVAGSVGFSPVNLISDGRRFPVLKAQLKEISVDSSPNSSTKKVEKEEISSSNDKEESSSRKESISESAISTFMDEATRLILLVDTSDVTELKLKHNDFELEIRKKEALEQPAPPPTPPPVMQYPPFFPYAMSAPPLPPAAAAPAPATPLTAQAAAPARPDVPPLKSPMAGTFYRAPSPTAPPFVKIGDKVTKGQVVCIIEAMKLMNEIEADKSGTVVDIPIENGKPVSLGKPLMVIQP